MLFIDTNEDALITSVRYPRSNRSEGSIPAGRNRFYVCHHPVFNADGTRLLFNTMNGKNAQLTELTISDR